MKFKNDQHRKAVFANLFGREDKKSKVNSKNVTNFEVKSVKQKREANKTYGKFVYSGVRLKDIKTKGEKEFCDMCRRKGLSLKKGRCNVCTGEAKKFKQPKEKVMTEELLEALNFLQITEEGLDDEIRNTRMNMTDFDGSIPEEDQDILANMELMKSSVLTIDRKASRLLQRGKTEHFLIAFDEALRLYDEFSQDDLDFKDVVELNYSNDIAERVLKELKELYQHYDIKKPYWVYW